MSTTLLHPHHFLQDMERAHAMASTISRGLRDLDALTKPNDITAVPGTSRYGGSYLHEAVQSLQRAEKATSRPRDELRLYLDSGTESADDVIAWWGVRALSLPDWGNCEYTNARIDTRQTRSIPP
jgi:hypothetical protein